MEIRIQIEKNLIPEDVIGSPVSDEEDINLILGEIVAYDTITGIAVCELTDTNKKDDDKSSFPNIGV